MLSFPRLGDYGYLGNAMFQYSALLGISDKHGYTPVYDYKKTGTMVTLHEHFNLSKAEEMEHWKQVHGIKRMWKEPHYNFAEIVFETEMEEKNNSVQEDIHLTRTDLKGAPLEDTKPILRIRDNTGLNGYFQSEKYFKHIEDDIRLEFKFPEETEKDCESKIQQIKDKFKPDEVNVVGVHIRLGDYKMLEHIYVPLIKTSYYQDALSHMENELKTKIVFLIFSDEPEMCKQFFQGGSCVFAEGGSPSQDMCLMSKCDHNVIANSSFSWWGAWLNDKENKKVIAPKNWFIPNEKDQKDTKDLYCDDWILL